MAKAQARNPSGGSNPSAAPAVELPNLIVMERDVTVWRLVPPHSISQPCDFRRGKQVSNKQDIADIVALVERDQIHGAYSVIF